MITPKLNVQYGNLANVEIKFGFDNPKNRNFGCRCAVCGAACGVDPVGPVVSTVEGDEPVCLDCLPEGLTDVLQSAHVGNYPEEVIE